MNKIQDSKIRIKLVRTQKDFRVKYKHEKKYYVFNVTVTNIMEGYKLGQVVDVKRMKYNIEDCKEPLSRKTVREIKETIAKKFE
jgi:hypothetical protein